MTGACATRCPDGCDMSTLRALAWGIPPQPAPRPRPMVAAGPRRVLPPRDVTPYLPGGSPRRAARAPEGPPLPRRPASVEAALTDRYEAAVVLAERAGVPIQRAGPVLLGLLRAGRVERVRRTEGTSHERRAWLWRRCG